MPTLVSETEIKLEWADINGRTPKKRRSTGQRSSGVHLSAINKLVLEAGGLLKPDDLNDEMPIRMAIGMAWEEWAVGLWPALMWQPGECHRDGVYGSPDGVTSIAVPSTILEEFKYTWKSSRDRSGANILSERLWMYQLYGYCHMMSLRYARLHVMWSNGDYRPPAPQYKTYLLEFSQAELDRYWTNIVLKNKDKAVPEQH